MVVSRKLSFFGRRKLIELLHAFLHPCAPLPLPPHPLIPALNEARDITTHLIPVRLQLEELESAQFEECSLLLRPLFNTLCLVWANSSYYNTPARMVVMLQEICNLIIEMVSSACHHWQDWWFSADTV